MQPVVRSLWRLVQVQEMEYDKRDLERQLNELKLKFEQAERSAAEQRQVDEKKHAEEIQFLKRTNQQLKVRTVARRERKRESLFAKYITSSSSSSSSHV